MTPRKFIADIVVSLLFLYYVSLKRELLIQIVFLDLLIGSHEYHLKCISLFFCALYTIFTKDLYYITESRRSSIDIFLKAAGYLDCAIQQVLPQLPPELRFI